MAIAPLKRCSKPGCRVLVRGESRCSNHGYKTERTQEAKEHNADFYNGHWKKLSEAYRRQNPLCVYCLWADRTQAAEAVDHIVPVRCLPKERWSWDNLCSTCWRCHNWKTRHEPKHAWIPRDDRIVLCGLRATGKTTAAKKIGLPYFDADDYGLGPTENTQDIVEWHRCNWMRKHKDGAMVLIASHPLSAANLAQQICGTVRHLTLDESERLKRFNARANQRGY